MEFVTSTLLDIYLTGNEKQWQSVKIWRGYKLSVSDVILFHMPVDLCRLLVGKNSEKCLSLWMVLNTLALLVSQWLYEHFRKLFQFYLNNTINFCHLRRRIISCYTNKMAIVSWPETPWRHITLCIAMRLVSVFLDHGVFFSRSFNTLIAVLPVPLDFAFADNFACL